MVKSAYSLVEHLAKSIWFSRWQEGRFAVFSAYFDASGTERNKFVCVAGFIASVDVWIEFERKWVDRLEKEKLFAKDGTPEFHMVECANMTEGYARFRDDLSSRQKLLEDLVEYLKMLGRKVVCIIEVEKYNARIDQEIRERFGLSATYVLGGRACAARVKEWCFWDRSPQLADVRFFFEHGDGKELQADLEFRFLEDSYPKPIFGLKRNKYSKDGKLIERRLVPFQAADVLSYLYYQEAKRGEDWGEKFSNIRWMFEEIKNIQEGPILLTDELIDGLNIYLRAAMHAIQRP